MKLIARRLILIVAAGGLAGAVPAAAQDWKGMGRMEGKVTDESGRPARRRDGQSELPERGGGIDREDGQEGGAGRSAESPPASGTSTSSSRATRAVGSA